MKRFSLGTLLIVLTFTAMAQERSVVKKGPDQKEIKKPKKETLNEMLGLTEGQRNMIRGLQVDHMKGVRTRRNDRDLKKAELQKAMSTDPIDEKYIYMLVDQINQLNAEDYKNEVKYKLAFRAVLSDDQRVIFDTVETDKKGKRNR